MDKVINSKIRHDMAGSITIIQTMANASSAFVEKIMDLDLNSNQISARQIELFKHSMQVIQDQAEELTRMLSTFDDNVN